MRNATLVFLFAVCVAPAQNCGPGETLLINDNLGSTITPGTPTAIIQGLCPGEGCGAVFDVSSVGSSVKVNLAAVAYISPPPATGLRATANIQVYDGITWSAAGIPTLGTLVFDLNALGNSVQLVSSNINTVDLSAANVVINSGTMVVAWTMNIQDPNAGSCAAGYMTNFATDYNGFNPACLAGTRKNLILIQGQGWRDSSLASVPGPFGPTPLCPIFLNGNWLIRACVEPLAGANPLGIRYSPLSPVTSGSIVFTTFDAGPSFAGQTYLALPSLSGNPPGSPLPFALNDPLVTLYINGDPLVNSIFLNFSGTLSGTGQGAGVISLPTIAPSALPITIFTGFATVDAMGNLTGVSDAAPLQIL